MNEYEACEKAEARKNARKLSRIRATRARPMYDQRRGYNVWVVDFENGTTLTIRDK